MYVTFFDNKALGFPRQRVCFRLTLQAQPIEPKQRSPLRTIHGSRFLGAEIALLK